jgi:Icc-related predicted phosphoesterase
MNLNIIHLTDIHGVSANIPKIADELSKADLIILSGDITHFGDAEDAGEIIHAISNYNKNILAVPGNCDNLSVNDYLNDKGINLNRQSAIINDLIFCGFGGSLPCPGLTPYEFTEHDAKKWLSELISSLNTGKTLIFVSHQPPINTINDQLNNGDHVGSKSVREFIEVTSPILCLTGHIHEGNGIDRIGKCIIVNPGPLSKGKYAIIKITGERKIYSSLKQITVH